MSWTVDNPGPLEGVLEDFRRDWADFMNHWESGFRKVMDANPSWADFQTLLTEEEREAFWTFHRAIQTMNRHRAEQPDPWNAVLRGGARDGVRVWLDDSTKRLVGYAGDGDYLRTDEVEDGRTVFRWEDLQADIAEVNELLDQFGDAVESKGSTLDEMDARAARVSDSGRPQASK